jgi:hypothetical protein
MAILVALETVALVLLTVLVAGLLRSHGEILRQLHALGAGIDPDAAGESPVALRPRGDVAAGAGLGAAHDIVGPGLHEDALHIPVVDVHYRTLLAFLSSGCLTCRTFFDAFSDAGALGLPDDMRLVVVTKDKAEESTSTLRDLAPADLPLVMSSDAWREYDVPGSPHFVLVDGAAGRVTGEGTGLSWPQIQHLIAQASADAADALVDVTTEVRIDRELIASGIHPGHPSLAPTADQITRDA